MFELLFWASRFLGLTNILHLASQELVRLAEPPTLSFSFAVVDEEVTSTDSLPSPAFDTAQRLFQQYQLQWFP